jgi:hypothetical protein
MLVQGSAGGNGPPACSNSMEMPSGVRMKAMRLEPGTHDESCGGRRRYGVTDLVERAERWLLSGKEAASKPHRIANAGRKGARDRTMSRAPRPRFKILSVPGRTSELHK